MQVINLKRFPKESADVGEITKGNIASLVSRNQKAMRIGLHTGTVLAGVVGRTMAKYCLFGNNVTIANKFESGSEPLKTNVSPTTYKLLASDPGFHFEPRPISCLPKGFPEHITGTCYFLHTYKHPDVAADQLIENHILAAIKELSFTET